MCNKFFKGKCRQTVCNFGHTSGSSFKTVNCPSPCDQKAAHCTMGCLRSLMTPYQNNPRIRYGAITNDSVSAEEQWQMTPCSLRSNYDSVSNDQWFPFYNGCQFGLLASVGVFLLVLKKFRGWQNPSKKVKVRLFSDFFLENKTLPAVLFLFLFKLITFPFQFS